MEQYEDEVCTTLMKTYVIMSTDENLRSVLELASCLNNYPVPENGIVIYSNNAIYPPYPALTTANIRCNPGYAPVGPVIATCQNRIWYPPIATQCIQYDRGNVYTGCNWIALYFDFGLYNVSSPPTVTLTGNCVTGIAPPTNGYINYSTGSSKRPFPTETVATMSCDLGFRPVGVTSSTCLNGIWSPPVLGQCVHIGSKLYGVPLDGSISETRAGHCPALVSPVNGWISYSNGAEKGSFPTGTTAIVTCNPNYILLGLSTAVCTNGVFSPLLLAHCVPGPENVDDPLKIGQLPCIPIPKPLNGNLTYSDITAALYASKTTATLVCKLGFVPVGPVDTICMNGQWQPALGFCQQSIIGSGMSQAFISRQCLFELPVVANAKIRYSTGNILPPYDSGTIARLICNSGSTPIGEKFSTCINGSWNPPMLGQCPVNGNDKGHLMFGLKQTVLPLIGCSTSPPVSNGKVYYSNVSKNNMYAVDTVANLVCDDGYILVGRSISYCQSGIWSPWPGVGSCQPYTQEQQQQYTIKPKGACSEVPITPANGMIIYESNESTTWYSNGTSAKLQCNADHKISGKEVTYCRDGFWIPSVGICQPIISTETGDFCEPFNSPPNGKVYYIYNNYTKDYQTGTTAILSCNKGYRVEGETTLMCNKNGWTPNSGFGICIPVDDSFHKHS
uniref:Sushi, von Willebrand factor type A, EGF and pentraxin domain-containing protein 1 n=1 Tax=Loa loa TaxID=7209 RepID=A0A1I7VSH6_LOALO